MKSVTRIQALRLLIVNLLRQQNVVVPLATMQEKKIKGRKRHILVDIIGLIIGVIVHKADIQDRDGAKMLLSRLCGKLSRLKLIWAGGGYAGKLIDWVKDNCKWVLEIVKRSDGTSGFKVLPRRWVVERTFGWLGRYRRLREIVKNNIPILQKM